ncbi:VOC family protein [Micromonospora sp. NPDC049101]|uniref:VOC family protein n=1 Tax=unclassified Micromonospora TaxID=2617518 RepID=UPI0033E98B3E
MSIDTVAHVNLRGNARAALEFYRSVFGGDLVAVTYAEAQNVQHPDEADQVMWGQVTSAEGFQIMAYDVPSGRPWSPGESPFFVSVRGRDADEITGYWKKLSEGATIVVDLAPAGWAPLYGMLTDPFGITWVLDVAVANSPA